MYLFLLFLFILILILVIPKYNCESLEMKGPTISRTEKAVLNTLNVDIPQKKLPITPNYNSNTPIFNYSPEAQLFVNPDRYKDLKNSVQQQDISRSSLQPESMYFDIFDINCTQPFRRPWTCLLIKGNFVNNIPLKYCEKVCPENFKKKVVESFKNIVPKKVIPEDYWCYEYCKKGCTKHKYNPLEPWKNSCGQNGFSQVPLPVYLTENECKNDSLPCERLGKDECLGNPQCGWCTNGATRGFCFRSTPDGPFNLQIPCTPDRVKPTHSFKMGKLNPFEGIGQSWDFKEEVNSP